MNHANYAITCEQRKIPDLLLTHHIVSPQVVFICIFMCFCVCLFVS